MKINISLQINKGKPSLYVFYRTLYDVDTPFKNVIS